MDELQILGDEIDVDERAGGVFEVPRVGVALPAAIDALLAATAKVHGMTLATRNSADVADLGADVLNAFEPVTG